MAGLEAGNHNLTRLNRPWSWPALGKAGVGTAEKKIPFNNFPVNLKITFQIFYRTDGIYWSNMLGNANL